MSTISGIAAAVRRLTARADALGRQCETLAGLAQDEASRATLARTSGRLNTSVVRPLSTSVVGVPDVVESPAPLGEADLADALLELALDATRLRVRAGAPSLQEATAALQDLACQAVAGDDERLQARQAELAALLETLPPTIQSAPDGPYLITNVAGLTDYLGVPLAATPQAALCRCGASELKPWCDGSHAQIGFHADKADDRVADRLDRYQGIGITVADNRGTCAHSGFCTDRLPSAFRSDREPFVAPAGGRVDEIIRAARECPSGALSATIDGEDPVGHSDQQRAPAIEVSRDGPYRVTGGVTLLDGDGNPEPRNEGASIEHYSLCRCGKSQNKPFCSGMHWYADFHDPPLPAPGDALPMGRRFPGAAAPHPALLRAPRPRGSTAGRSLLADVAGPPRARRRLARTGVRRPAGLQRPLRRVRPDDQPAPRQGHHARSARPLGHTAQPIGRRGRAARRRRVPRRVDRVPGMGITDRR